PARLITEIILRMMRFGWVELAAERAHLESTFYRAPKNRARLIASVLCGAGKEFHPELIERPVRVIAKLLAYLAIRLPVDQITQLLIENIVVGINPRGILTGARTISRDFRLAAVC